MKFIRFGPQISQCIKSIGAWKEIKLEENDKRICLAKGQISQYRVNFSESLKRTR